MLVDLESQILEGLLHQKSMDVSYKTLERKPQHFQRTEGGIKGNVTSSKPATLHDAINMARELIEQGVQAKALRIAPAKGRGYAGNLPWCNRCKAHHQPGPCPPRCGKCRKLGH
ncbi:hypothetical protein Tco_0371317 [Tanacetum coccineum]